MGKSENVRRLVLDMKPPPGADKHSVDYRAQRILQRLANGNPMKIPGTVLERIPADLRPQYLGNNRWFQPPSREVSGRVLECLLLAGWR